MKPTHLETLLKWAMKRMKQRQHRPLKKHANETFKNTEQKYPVNSPALRHYIARYDEICPECGGCLDTGWECNSCGYDAMNEALNVTPNK